MAPLIISVIWTSSSLACKPGVGGQVERAEIQCFHQMDAAFQCVKQLFLLIVREEWWTQPQLKHDYKLIWVDFFNPVENRASLHLS